jgi:succinyl-diaminopimelate desuccinylase
VSSASTWHADQYDKFERAWALVDREDLQRTLVDMVAIASPPGREDEIVSHLAGRLEDVGYESQTQSIEGRPTNAVGRFGGTKDGPSLLLYSPIDTAFEGTEVADVPWLGDTLRPDFLPQPITKGDWIVGLGAENPKGFAACVLVAASAVARSTRDLSGSLLVGFGGGGMPTNRPRALGPGPAIGHGVGCDHMLRSGFRGDFAMLCKPGYAVSWEEVGLAWYRIRVRGLLGYTGVRHLLPYKNPIVGAGAVVARLEDWFPRYTKRFSAGTIAPQGAIGAIEAGWPHKPAFTPSACDIYVDVRLSPSSDLREVDGMLDRFLRTVEEEESLELSWERMIGIPGTRTDPDSWIVRSAIRAWEAIEGRAHEPIVNTSGATDAAILRGHGVPTARLGMPRSPQPPPFSGFSMGQANIDSMAALVKCLIWVVVDTCTRSSGEVAIDD